MRDLGPISVRKLLGFELVIVGGADLAAELNDDSRFGKDGRNLGPLRRIVGDGLFTAENDAPNWQLAHDILAPAFTREAMRGYHTIMLEVAWQLLTRWDTAADRGQRVDVTGDMTRVTLETIGRAGFGYRFGAFERDRSHPFVTAMNRALRCVNVAALVLVRRFLVGSAREHRTDIATMEQIVDEILHARRDGVDPEESDLMGLMLRATHPKTGQRLDPVNIRHQIITFSSPATRPPLAYCRSRCTISLKTRKP